VQINGFKLTQISGHIDKPIAILLTCSRLVCAIQFLGTRGLLLPTSHGHQHQNELRSNGPFFTARLAFVAPKAKTHNLKPNLVPYNCGPGIQELYGTLYMLKYSFPSGALLDPFCSRYDPDHGHCLTGCGGKKPMD
jgi:hypothetical protein